MALSMPPEKPDLQHSLSSYHCSSVMGLNSDLDTSHMNLSSSGFCSAWARGFMEHSDIT